MLRSPLGREPFIRLASAGLGRPQRPTRNGRITKERYLGAGMANCVSKPVSINPLLMKIEEYARMG